MDSLFFLLEIVAVGWLLVWATRPGGAAQRGWWPFDMRDAPPPPKPRPQPARRRY